MLNGTYIWKIKKLSRESTGCNIAIDKADGKYVGKNIFHCNETDKGSCYGIYGNRGYRFRSQKENGTHFRSFIGIPKFLKTGDIFTMKLKFTEKENIITVKLNDGEEVIAFDNILRKNGLNYRFAISLCDKGCSFELVE